jgi:beta-1,2-mannobiose phosphorylase / 1,2-beta-oligomannan phosphorylase
MKKTILLFLLIIVLLSQACNQNRAKKSENSGEFAKEMVEFTPYQNNPIFQATNSATWDQHIRERGFILPEDGIYKMWYTGYVGGDNDPKSLGYATSKDGIEWVRYSKNPIFTQRWTEDMFVMRNEGKYYMYAEGKDDIAHMLTSPDGLSWQDMGDLVILTVKGDTIHGPYGTPSIVIENGKWYLFYERNDEAIWLATSTDKITWTNVQDEPVLGKGKGNNDSGALAANQVVKFRGKYYMYYHGTSDSSWNVPGAISLWTSNVAMSTDLIHWVRYPKNPIVKGDHSSPILVPYGDKFRLYTMHNEIWMYNPK